MLGHSSCGLPLLMVTTIFFHFIIVDSNMSLKSTLSIDTRYSFCFTLIQETICMYYQFAWQNFLGPTSRVESKDIAISFLCLFHLLPQPWEGPKSFKIVRTKGASTRHSITRKHSIKIMKTLKYQFKKHEINSIWMNIHYNGCSYHLLFVDDNHLLHTMTWHLLCLQTNLVYSRGWKNDLNNFMWIYKLYKCAFNFKVNVQCWC